MKSHYIPFVRVATKKNPNPNTYTTFVPCHYDLSSNIRYSSNVRRNYLSIMVGFTMTENCPGSVQIKNSQDCRSCHGLRRSFKI